MCRNRKKQEEIGKQVEIGRRESYHCLLRRNMGEKYGRERDREEKD